MFNNIGLPTPRGSGTNGYIQRSLASCPIKRSGPKDDLKIVKAKVRTRMDPSLLEHERRRAVEIQLLDLIDQLKSKGLNDDEIKLKVQEERAIAMERIERERENVNVHQTDAAKLDTHRQAELKYRQLERAAEAFGIKEDTTINENTNSESSRSGSYSRSQSRSSYSGSYSSVRSRSSGSESRSDSHTNYSDKSGSNPRRYNGKRSLSRDRSRDRSLSRGRERRSLRERSRERSLSRRHRSRSVSRDRPLRERSRDRPIRDRSIRERSLTRRHRERSESLDRRAYRRRSNGYGKSYRRESKSPRFKKSRSRGSASMSRSES